MVMVPVLELEGVGELGEILAELAERGAVFRGGGLAKESAGARKPPTASTAAAAEKPPKVRRTQIM